MRGRRKVWGSALALTLATVGIVAVSSAPAHSYVGEVGSTSGRPVFATGGSASQTPREQISWLSFGGHGDEIASGASATNSVVVSAVERVEVACSLERVSGGALQGYRPGSSAGDGLDNRFHVTGMGTSNGLIVGVRKPAGAEAVFDVTCTGNLVKYDGLGWDAGNWVASQPFEVPGLVFADAGMTVAGEESLAARPLPLTENSDVSWRILDASSGGCVLGPVMQARHFSNGTLEFETRTALGWGLIRECTSGVGTAMVTTFAEGTSGLRLTLSGDDQAAALGYILPLDFGDAPASYGVAGAQQLVWTRSDVLTGSSWGDVSGRQPSTFRSYGTTITDGTPRLGASLTTELAPLYAGDTADDAFSSSPVLSAASPGGLVTLAPRCRGTGWVTGWIDWNRNGVFDDVEQSTVGACTNTTNNDGVPVTLSWSVPADAQGGPTFARFIVAGDEAELGPHGIVSRGEVEDFAVSALIRKLSVTKTADQVQIPDTGGVVTYTVTVTNVGNAAYTAGDPAWVYDSYAEADDDADLGTPTGAPPGPSGVDTTNRFMWWSGALATGASATFTIPMTVSASPGDRVMTNVARVSSTQLTTAQITAPCAAGSPEETAGACASSVLYRADLEVTKRAYLESDSTFSNPLPDGIALAEDTAVVWRYTVSNTGSIALTDIVLTDVASETRTNVDGAVLTETDTVITCDGLPPDTSVTIPTLAAGASLTCQAEGVIGGT